MTEKLFTGTLNKNQNKRDKYAYIQKLWHYYELQRKITVIALACSSCRFLLYIYLEDKNVFVRFDGIPSISLTILKKQSIQKPLIIRKGNKSNSIGP